MRPPSVCKHVHRGHAAFFVKPTFTRLCIAGARGNRRSSSRLIRIITGAPPSFFDKQRGNDVRDRAAALRAIAAARVFVHQDNVFRLQSSQRTNEKTACATPCVEVWICSLPFCQKAIAVRDSRLMADVRAHECFVEDRQPS